MHNRVKTLIWCPLQIVVSKFTTKTENVMQRYLLNHEENAVRFKGILIYLSHAINSAKTEAILTVYFVEQ